MQRTVDWLLARPWRAPLTFVLLGIIPDNSYVWLFGLVLTTALLTLVCLRNGFGRALELMLTGLLMVAVVGYLMQRVDDAVWYPQIDSRLAMWVPAVLTGLVIRRTQSLALGIQLLVLVALGLTGALFALTDPVDYWRAGWSSELRPELLRVLTGILAAGYLVCLISGILLARAAERMAAPGDGSPPSAGALERGEFATLTMGKVLATVCALFFLLGVFESAVYFANGTWVLAAGFAFQGLSVLQEWLAQRNMTGPWLVLLCLALALAIPVTVPLMAALGFVDNWFDLRTQLRPQK
jgi:hypothetical protein